LLVVRFAAQGESAITTGAVVEIDGLTCLIRVSFSERGAALFDRRIRTASDALGLIVSKKEAMPTPALSAEPIDQSEPRGILFPLQVSGASIA